jgi:cytochrome P450
MLAGSETTSKTLTWIFLDIAKHPKVQDRLREEIRAQQKLITLRGDTEFSLKDYDEMSYLKAVVKEGLRLHPPLPTAFRMTGKDDVIPLSKPLTTISGKVIHEVAVPAGTRIFTSIPAYNR